LSTEFPTADGTLENSGQIIYDNSNDFYVDLDYTVGNVFDAVMPDTPLAGTATYMAAGGDPNDKFNDPNVYSDGFTISAWINPVDLHDDESLNKHWGIFATKGGYDGPYVFYYEKGKVVGLIRTENEHPRNDGTLSVPAESWSHVAMVWNPNVLEGSELVFYVNGQLDSGDKTVVTTANLLDPFPTYPFTVGFPGVLIPDAGVGDPPINSLDIVGKPFRGGIDDVRVYNKALTQEEIACLSYRCTATTSLVGGDCYADLNDFSDLADGWQTTYTLDDLKALGEIWLQAFEFPVY
jgi:hypothetical protein